MQVIVGMHIRPGGSTVALLPDLAASLNDLSKWLGALERNEEGLAAVEEADALRATAELHLTADRPEHAAEAAATALDLYASDNLNRAPSHRPPGR